MPPGTRTLLNNPHYLVTVAILATWGIGKLQCWAESTMRSIPEIKSIDILMGDDGFTLNMVVSAPGALVALNKASSLWEQDIVDEIEVKPISSAGLERFSSVVALGDLRRDSA